MTPPESADCLHVILTLYVFHSVCSLRLSNVKCLVGFGKLKEKGEFIYFVIAISSPNLLSAVPLFEAKIVSISMYSDCMV